MREKRVPADVKRAVSIRAHGCCEYCRTQERFAAEALSVEHVQPRNAGGRTTLPNLALSCQGCNNHKHTKTHAPDPVSGATVPLYHPRTQRWSDHFAWSPDYATAIGLTPTGRATVAALKLNRDGLVNLRRVLAAAGEHPPSGPDAGG